MDNFIVSARKYRPNTFDTVVGQSAITSTLKNAIKSGHIAQSFLFCGPRGVGKTTCARILAKTINCSNFDENVEACGECESCKSFQNNASHNVYELDAASNRSVDDIKSLIEQVRIPPQIGNYKVYIIDEVHMLTSEAFNAFLKTLEEPPVYAKFILATTEKNKIIPTILSRCQIFDFKRIKIADMAEHLANIAEKEGIQADKEALHLIAQKADGGLRDALSMFDQVVSFSNLKVDYTQTVEMLNILDYDYFFKLIDHVLVGNVSEVLNIFNEIMENGFDGQHFILGLGNHLRNLLVMQNPATIDLIEVGEGVKEKFGFQASQCSLRFLVNALELQNFCDINYRSSNNKRLTVEILLLQMVGLMTDFTSTPNPTVTEASAPVASAVNTPATPATLTSPVAQESTPNPTVTVASAVNTPATPAIPTSSVTQESTPNPTVTEASAPVASAPTTATAASPVVQAPAPASASAPTTATAASPVVQAPAPASASAPTTATVTSPVVQAPAPAPASASAPTTASQNKVYRSANSIKLPKESSAEQDTEKKKPIVDQEFTQAMLENAWHEVSEEMKKEQPALNSLMCTYIPLLKQDALVLLKFATQLQNESFQFCQLEILAKMREKLSNFSLRFEVELEESLITTKLYSPKDKYNKMVDDNPNLGLLQSELDLDIDF